MAGKGLPKWSEVKPLLLKKPQGEMVRLVQDLFNHSTDNKAFIAARLRLDQGREGVIEEYRQKIVQQFAPKRGLPRLDLRSARKAIRDYRKATEDLPGTVDLMLSYLEYGVGVTEEYGDMYEGFYNSLESVLSETAEILKKAMNAELFYTYEDRLRKLRSRTCDMGWGLGDFFADEIQGLEDYYREAET